MRSNLTCFHVILPKELSWRSTWPLCQILLTTYGRDAGTWGRGDQVQPCWEIHQGPLHIPLFPTWTTRSHKFCPQPQKALKSPEKHSGWLITGKSQSICDKRQLGLLCLKSKLNITMQNYLARLQWVTHEKWEDICQITMCVLTKGTFEWDLIDCPESHWKKLYVCWTTRD